MIKCFKKTKYTKVDVAGFLICLSLISQSAFRFSTVLFKRHWHCETSSDFANITPTVNIRQQALVCFAKRLMQQNISFAACHDASRIPRVTTKKQICAVFFLGAWVLYTKLRYLRNGYAGLLTRRQWLKKHLRESLRKKFVLCKLDARSL